MIFSLILLNCVLLVKLFGISVMAIMYTDYVCLQYHIITSLGLPELCSADSSILNRRTRPSLYICYYSEASLYTALLLPRAVIYRDHEFALDSTEPHVLLVFATDSNFLTTILKSKLLSLKTLKHKF